MLIEYRRNGLHFVMVCNYLLSFFWLWSRSAWGKSLSVVLHAFNHILLSYRRIMHLLAQKYMPTNYLFPYKSSLRWLWTVRLRCPDIDIIVSTVTNMLCMLTGPSTCLYCMFIEAINWLDCSFRSWRWKCKYGIEPV